MSLEDTKVEAASLPIKDTPITPLLKNPLNDRGPPEVPKKTLGKLSCFARGSNIECLVSHDDIMPQKPARRVRDLGREIVDRANRCTWYDNMVQDELQPLDKKDSKEIADDDQSDVGEASQKSSSVDICGDENENKMLLKRLEKQQKALLKQQHALNKQLGLEVNQGDLGIIDSKSELIDDTDKPFWKSPSSGSLRKSGSHQRRLRGDVARQCAERSEGSIKSLIWNDESDELNAKPSESECISSNASVDASARLIERTTSCAGKINSSSAISALISNSFCDSLQ